MSPWAPVRDASCVWGIVHSLLEHTMDGLGDGPGFVFEPDSVPLPHSHFQRFCELPHVVLRNLYLEIILK